ncbi:MAG: hypothetical protein R2724_16675 [Bryobacterales bacterium]
MVRAAASSAHSACWVWASAPPEAPFASLEDLIEYQIEDKGIPALSIALVDGQDIVYAEDFGEAPEDAVYRVGSVSKLYTTSL